MPWRPLGLREVEAPTFSDIRHTDGGKVVRATRRPLFTPGKIPGIHFFQRLKTLGKLKKSTSSGTRTGGLPACSVVPEPIMLPCAPVYYFYFSVIMGFSYALWSQLTSKTKNFFRSLEKPLYGDIFCCSVLRQKPG
jgi:hypothetical protein